MAVWNIMIIWCDDSQVISEFAQVSQVTQLWLMQHSTQRKTLQPHTLSIVDSLIQTLTLPLANACLTLTLT